MPSLGDYIPHRSHLWGEQSKQHVSQYGGSKNSATPKSSIWIGFSIINHPIWGTPIFGNTHINSYASTCSSCPNLWQFDPGAEKKGDNTMLCRPEIMQSSMQRLIKEKSPNSGFLAWSCRIRWSRNGSGKWICCLNTSTSNKDVISIWVFPKIAGFPPKSSILIGFSIINHPFWGTPIFGNTHIQKIASSCAGRCLRFSRGAGRCCCCCCCCLDVLGS